MLVREVQHRTRNMLSVIQAIATQSFDGPLVPTKVRDAFIRRLQALAHAQTFVAAGPGGGVPTRELLTAALLSFGPRVRIACDATLIDGSTAQTLALVMHELASNSTQFGALSVEPGSVEVSCVFDSSLVPGQLRLAWTERGGPPVSPPERTGFGARLLRVAGTAQLDFDRAGFAYRLAVPIPPHSMVM